MTDLIVIGAGPGGYEAAAHAGKKGKKVILFERQYIGGTCLNVGCIPTKTLLKSAHVFAECKHAAAYGVEDTGTPKLNMVKAQERKAKVVATLTKGVEALLKKSGVEVIRAHAEIKGAGKVEADGKIYEAANILIATGSKPATPPIPGINNPKVLDSTSILALNEIPETLAVIGGGVIGLEFASFFADAGSKVTVVEMLPQIAPVVDSEITKRLQMAMKKKGVQFNLNAKVTKIDGSTLHFTDESGAEQSLTATYILNSTGRTAVVDGLGLEAAGIEFTKRGITADESGRTNIPGIWACGDVTGRCQLAHAATREGIAAVENMFGGKQKIRYTAIPSVVYTNPEVASCGKTEDQLTKEGVAFKKSVMPMGVAGRFLVEYEGESGTVKVLTGEHGVILGVHMIGGPAGEHIFGAAMMIEQEMRVKDIFEIVFPHPTISEALKEAIIHAE
ncbi:MAG: dihydrolipoyl dehydrogenase [Fibrobacteres bacterium]|nr:dihydrolipoyl dehydrogenase [Fibrobacterota bacterium]